MRVLGDYVLICLTAGNGYYADGFSSRSIELKAGDFLLIRPEQPHAYGPMATENWEHSYVVFVGPQFDLMLGSSNLFDGLSSWHLEPVAYWGRRLEEVFSGLQQRGEPDALRAVGRFVALLTDVAASLAESGTSQAEAWLPESLRLLGEPVGEEWTLPTIVAQRVGLSYENFRKRFAASVGEAPGRYQRRRKIERACSAIYEESAPFKRIAEELGFCDVYHFSRAFKQFTGESPSAYRRRFHGR